MTIDSPSPRDRADCDRVAAVPAERPGVPGRKHPILSVEELTKTYAPGAQRSVDALRGISFGVEEGEFIALMGPSGCGKSTLLHLLGAMDTPSTGKIVFDGEDLAPLDEEALALRRRDKVGFVFQFFNLLPTLDLVENVALPAQLQGCARDTARSKAAGLLDRVGLGQRSDHFTSELSGGEMQRAAVARALVTKPRLILADEPTGSLDSHNGALVMALLKELNEETGVTTVVATHSDDVASYAGRTLRLRDGRIESDIREASRDAD